jgi:hypothetical protein
MAVSTVVGSSLICAPVLVASEASPVVEEASLVVEVILAKVGLV